MTMRTHDADRLMTLVLDGEATPDEAALLDRQLAGDSALRTRFAAWGALFDAMGRVPAVHPPEGLVARVMANIPHAGAPSGSKLPLASRVLGVGSEAVSPIRRSPRPMASLGDTMNDQTTPFNRRKIWIGAGLAAIAVVVVGGYALDVPPGIKDTAGTIVPASRFIAPQTTAVDVQPVDRRPTQTVPPSPDSAAAAAADATAQGQARSQAQGIALGAALGAAKEAGDAQPRDVAQGQSRSQAEAVAKGAALGTAKGGGDWGGSNARDVAQGQARDQAEGKALAAPRAVAKDQARDQAEAVAKGAALGTAKGGGDWGGSNARDVAQGQARDQAEGKALAAPRSVAQDQARSQAQGTARSTAQDQARSQAQGTARSTAQDQARSQAQGTALGTARDAALGIAK